MSHLHFKMIFLYVLVLKKYNLFGKKFDDGKMYDAFIESMVEFTRIKLMLLIRETKRDETKGEKAKGEESKVEQPFFNRDDSATH